MSSSGIVGAIANAVRRERERTGMSLSELARAAGLGKSTLSQIEAGTGNPGIETLWALCMALQIPVSRLIESRAASAEVIRAGEGPTIESNQSNYIVTLLGASPPGARRDIYRLQVEPGNPRRSDAHMYGTTEHMILTSGRALIGPLSGPVELRPGDYIRYAGDEPHIFDALETGTTALLILEHI